MSCSREQLLAAARSHPMWPRTKPRPEDSRYVRHDVVCSCGFELRDTDWIDDVVLSDLQHGNHRGDFVIAYPEETPQQSIGGVFVSTDRSWGWPVDRRDLEWLLAQSGLPDEFRRAAAVHL